MTERKPAGQSWESWIDRQIREAEERGSFDDLPGKGKPIPDLDRSYDELWWVKQKLRRENISVLPPSIALRKEVEDALDRIGDQPSETAVRRLVEDLNAKIDRARRATSGPPLRLRPLDADEVVARWRERRQQRP